MTFFSLAQGAVVQAGAGTGKTHSLVTLCLHLLGGAGRAAPLAPAALGAVTFTEKAAAELRERLRLRLDRLAEADADAERRRLEPELFATLDAAGQAPPAEEVWRRARRDLGQAQVGTLHGLCAQILRRHAAPAGLDPAFVLLDELEARALLRDVCERAVLEALDGDAGARAAAARLCAEWGFRGVVKFQRGLADELEVLARVHGESGLRPADALRETPGLSRAPLVAAEQEARRRLAGAFELIAEAARGGASQSAQLGAEAAGLFAPLRPSLLGGAPLAELWPRLAPLADRLQKARAAGAMAESVKAVRAALDGVLEAGADLRALELSPDLARLGERALDLYAAEKERRGALDFDDLTRRARELLAGDAAVRRAEKARLGALLVDEFQDTSRAQLELVGWLCEEAAGEGSAPPGSGTPGARPLAPGKLAVVGDLKQSIYEFRGADLAGVRRFSAQALADGAALHRLGESRRSRPALVELCNRLFARALGPARQEFEAPFVAGEDDLRAARPAGPPGPCAELLDLGRAEGEDEADAVARRVAALLAPGATERVHARRPDGSEEARPVRGGDVAILFRSLARVDDFRRALLRWRVPHLLVKGRGFHQAREVLDLRALLSLLLDPDDGHALAAVLRSPLGPLSDGALALLALARPPPAPGEPEGPPPKRGRLRLRALRDPALLARLEPDDAAAAARLASLIERLRRLAGRLGPAALLEAALAETGYVAALAGGLFGEQAAANVAKLVDLARAQERRGGGVRELLARLELLDDDVAGEPEAPVAEERDPHAVRLFTVHGAKGLEFPIVIVPECGVAPPNLAGRVLYDPDLGLALKVRAADGMLRWGQRGGAVRERREQREAAEARRLLYVAATRARDLLVLAGRVPQRSGTWRAVLDDHLPSDPGLLRRLAATELPRPASPPGRAALDSLEALEAAASAPAPDHAALPVLAAPPGPGGCITATVTQLSDAQACALRYRLLHELGMEERPQARAPAPPPLDPQEGEGDPGLLAAEHTLSATERGTLAHRLLERVPLEAAGDRAELRRGLERLLAAEGEAPAAHGPLLDGLTAFLDGPLGRRLRAAGPGLARRELPFALRLAPPEGATAPALVVHGQIDALLLEPGAATVIDYKHAEKRPVARYGAQLDAYALAAHTLVEGATPVRAGLVFLKSRGAFVEREPLDEAARERARAGLLQAAAAIEAGRRTGAWPKEEPARCEALDCGFLRRCHPGS